MMTDPIADMLTRMRNAILREKATVDVPLSGQKVAIAETLKREGFIKDIRCIDAEPSDILRVYLKYAQDGTSVIRQMKRMSKPSQRLYSRTRGLKPILGGLGTVVLSTSKGIMSDREARKHGMGGEVLFTVS
jgi:small subunit ribosomal protein S8